MTFVRFAVLACLALALSACGGEKTGTDRFAYVEEPVELLYARGTQSLESNRYQDAIAYFAEVERQHPYSAWARRSMLMTAYTLYLTNDFEASRESIDRFLAIHPGNKDAGYAYYLRAMTYYERIRDVGRDQEITRNAATALTDVVRRYPDTEYARDAQLKLDLTRDHLAGKEMAIGRWYLRKNQHVAAIGRFNNVLENYQTTSHVAEALHRSVESYLELGLVTEALRHAAILGYNYPESDWYQDTYRVFRRYGRDLEARVERLEERPQEAVVNEDELSPVERLEAATGRPVTLENAPEALPPEEGTITPDLPGAPPESL